MIRFLDKDLSSPLFISSGIVAELDTFKDLSLDPYGFVILKTVTLKPRDGNPPPRVWDGRCAMFNSIGLANEGLKAFLETTLPKLEEFPLPVVVSISPFSLSEVEEFLPLFHQNIWAIELNLSCPNVEHGHNRLISQDIEFSRKIVSKVRANFRGKLIVKVSPEMDNLPALAMALVDEGVDALDVANTYPGLVLDVEQARPIFSRIFAGVSGPAILPLTLKRIWEVYESVDVPILGSGGVLDWKDAISMALSGAAVVGIGSALYRDPHVGNNIWEGIKEYLSRKSLSWREIIGLAHDVVSQ